MAWGHKASWRGGKLFLLIHTISPIWWSLLETKLTDTLSGLNRQRQIVLGGESQGESSVNPFFPLFFFFLFVCVEVEIVQSEK